MTELDTLNNVVAAQTVQLRRLHTVYTVHTKSTRRQYLWITVCI